MLFVVISLSIYVFIKTIGYALFEIKQNANKPAGIIIAILGVFCLITPTIATLL